MGDPNADCDEHHNRWYDRDIVPRVRLLILGALSAVMTIGVGVVMYVSTNNVRDHALQDRETFVSRRDFDATVARIEVKVDRLETSVNNQMNVVSDKLDRNLAALQRMK